MTRFLPFVVACAAVLLQCAPAQASDPLAVIQRAAQAQNDGDLEGVLAQWADDGVFVNTRGRRSAGKEAIRGFVRGNIASGLRGTINAPVVSGEKVTWQGTDDTGFYRQLGVAPVRIVSEATVRDGKIVLRVGYIPDTEIDRIEEACKAPEAAKILLFGQPCGAFIAAARAHTRAALAR